MAKRKQKQQPKRSFFDDLSPQTKQAIGAVGFVVLGIFLTLSLSNLAGDLGVWTKVALDFLFGGGSFLAPFVCGFYVYALLNPKDDEHVSTSKIFGIACVFLASLGFLALYESGLGGIIGMALEWPLQKLTGSLAAGFIMGALWIVGVFLTFNTGLLLSNLFKRKEKSEEDEEFDPLILPIADTDTSPVEIVEDEASDEKGDNRESGQKKSMGQRLGLSKDDNFVVTSFSGPYAPPPLSLLNKDKGKPNVGDVKANSNIIKRTLKKFNIEVEMDEVTIGSSVTRYAIKPAEGVRLEKIVGLQTNLEYALAAHPIRIEAPIPGKSLVGIEVPNAQKQIVGLASVFTSPEYTDSPKPLLVALGKDITGKAHFANVARMPHGLIAGTTGSGKSVMIHNLIISLLFRNSPEQLRFIMVDPKRVELTLYNGIPHLLTPVITEAKKVILSLKWAIKEMERRLDVLQGEKVQNVGSYHETVYQPAKEKFEKNKTGVAEEDEALRQALPEPLPYIVIIIDELADLMQAYPKELEACIVRLAQMSRAVGIHLILTTQRPSVNVITGTIKANVPTRLAFQVASQIDSRTILDMAGAEKLLGQGDMLFLSAEQSKPTRLQSAFVSTEEVNKVVAYLKDQSSVQELDSINLEPNKDGSSPDAFFGAMVDSDEDDDELYEDAKQAVLEANKASTSYLQRKLRVGYSRAARLIDILEERGVIGPADGAKSREILAGRDGDDANYDDERKEF